MKQIMHDIRQCSMAKAGQYQLGKDGKQIWKIWMWERNAQAYAGSLRKSEGAGDHQGADPHVSGERSH